MASYIASLQDDLANGFSKRELEDLIGLPKNSLASILTGKRNLSLKSQLKIKRWEASEKPNPLDIAKYENDVSKIDPKAGDMQEANKVLHEGVKEYVKGNSILTSTVDNTDLPNHPLYKKGDPKENTNSFYLKYGAFTYNEIKK